MTRWLVKFKMMQQYWSLPSEEQMKLTISWLEMNKAYMDAGLVKDWAVNPNGSEGYKIIEGSETQVYESILKEGSLPYASFEVIPVIPFQQFHETMKKQAVVGAR